MQKGERLEISVSMLATEEFPDLEAMTLGDYAVKKAVEAFTANYPLKRFCSGVSIGSAIQETERSGHGERKK